MLPPLLGAVLPALLLLGGCHAVSPYVSEPSADAAPADAPRADAPQDRGPPEADAPSIEIDGQPPATDGFCQLQPLEPTRVACGCAGSSDDCDGLPSGRDLQPDRCNRLLYEEQFAENPIGAGRWTTALGDWAASDGCLHQRTTTNPPGTQRWYWARATNAALATPSYLVEARLRLGAIGEADYWQAGVAARMASTFAGPDQLPPAFISCVARVDRALDTCYGCSPPRKVENPDLRIEARSADHAEWEGAWPLDNPPGLFSGAAGEVLLLQLWLVPDPLAIHCRLLDAAGVTRREAFYRMHGEDASFAKFLPAEPGSVGLRTWGRAASFDYLRVFELHAP